MILLDLLLALFILLVFCLSGTLISSLFFKHERELVKLILGVCIGLVLMMWLPVPFSIMFGFTITSQILALSSVIALGILAFRHGGTFNLKSLASEKLAIITTLPLLIITTYLFFTHILAPNQFGGLNSGQSTFGDLPLHLALVTSISNQQTFPPYYSILANSILVGYPFLCNSISATLYTFGVSLRLAFITPMIFALIPIFCGTFIFFEKWLHSQKKASVSTILFFIGGGFGFVYFVDLLKLDPDNFKSIFTGFYTTPTNFSEKNILWVNVIADLLIPQRATLFGLCILIPCIYILYSLVFENKTKYFLPLGLLVGSLPLIHTHSFLAIGIMSTVCFLFCIYDYVKTKNFSLIKFMLFYASIALTLALPQLFIFTFNQALGSDSFLRFHFNWVNDKDNYFWFYIKNLGLIYFLIIPAFFNASRDKQIFYMGGIAILIISEFIVFQPNKYDNNKLLLTWFFLSCGLVTDFLTRVFDLLKHLKGIKIFAIIVFFTMNFSGLLTLGREAISEYELFNRHNIEASTFIEKNTATDALFLTGTHHNNTVASLAGRTIFCGTEIYLFFHGIDYSEHRRALNEMYNYPSIELLKHYNIDYVYIGDFERYNFPDMDKDFFDQTLELIFTNGHISIYKV